MRALHILGLGVILNAGDPLFDFEVCFLGVVTFLLASLVAVLDLLRTNSSVFKISGGLAVSLVAS